MLFCKVGASFEISKKLKCSIEPFFCDLTKVGHVIYRWKGCLKLIKIHIRNRVRTSSREEIYAIFYCHMTKLRIPCRPGNCAASSKMMNLDALPNASIQHFLFYKSNNHSHGILHDLLWRRKKIAPMTSLMTSQKNGSMENFNFFGNFKAHTF